MGVLKYKDANGTWQPVPTSMNVMGDIHIETISAIQGEGTSNYLHFDLTKYHKTGKRFIMFYGLYVGDNKYMKSIWDSTEPETIYCYGAVKDSYMGAYGFQGWTTLEDFNGYVGNPFNETAVTLSYDEGILTVGGYVGVGTSTAACAAQSAVVIFVE